ncbi:MAG: hypothetical protein M3O01_09360 [Pseudomonadota bacterium]|nr:hypothetical protein [Pseudomonadota bacterium]
MTVPLFHIAFYRFVRIAAPADVATRLRALAQGLQGQVVVAPEGVNGALAGPAADLERYARGLRDAPELRALFGDMPLQRSACQTPPFGRLKVHVRAEILALGIGPTDPVGRPGTQLDPAAWRALLDDDGTVLLDNRNRFEFRLGRFRGAIEPGVGNYRDLPTYLARQAPRWKAENRRVAMYCTGGIRCEKTAPWLADEFGIEVLQLEGGILRYLATAPEPERDWQGQCFVFDNRIALDSRLRETATTAAEVYATDPDERWRLRRAERLDPTA